MDHQQQLSGVRVDDAPSGREGLLMVDLLATSETLSAALGQSLRAAQWLDAYLLSAGIFQLIEDRLHADPLQLRRGAAFLRGAGHSWSRRAGLAVAPLAWLSERFSQRPGTRRRLVEARDSIARLTSALASLVQDPQASPPTHDEVQMLADQAQACAALVTDDVVRLPACFRSFDLHPDDVRRLSQDFVARYGAPCTRVCVVGVRTSGSYLAPLYAASLRTSGGAPVDILTHRPGRPLQHWEKEVLRAVVHAGGRVIVTDDPPGTGSSIAATVAAIEAAGVPRDRVTLVLSLFSDVPELPAVLRGYDAVLQLWPELSVHNRLDATRVGLMLGQMLGPQWRVDRCLRRDPLTVRSTRRHAHARYTVELTDLVSGGHRRLAVMVEGAGLGYFGRHAVAVSSALQDRTPRIYGFADGLLYREWLRPAHEPMDEDTSIEVVSSYVAHRRRSLPAVSDPTRLMRGRAPVWEVAAELMSRVYGPLAPLVRPHLLEPLTRRLLESRRPSVVDGATDVHRWFPDPVSPGRWTKVDFHQRAFSHLEVACYDAAFDLAGAVADPPSQALAGSLRTAFHKETGEYVDGERWMLYRLAQLWRSLKAGEIDADTLARRSADAVHEYLKDCLLSDVSLGAGPVCAIDLDGVLETDRLGYPASGPGGVLALRALIAHGYRPVLATGRGLTDATDRCTTFGLAGAVAEYGAVIYDHQRRTSTDLRTRAEQDLMERVYEALDQRGFGISPGHQFTVRVQVDGGPLPADVVKAIPLLQDRQLRIVHGEGQSDVTVRRLDKAAGLLKLAECWGGPECALAVGDSMSDLSMLRAATVARSPRNADPRLLRAGIASTQGAYQAGLLDASSILLGHRPGRCPVCRTPPLPRRSRELLAVLALSEGGMRRLPRGTLNLMLLVATGRR